MTAEYAKWAATKYNKWVCPRCGHIYNGALYTGIPNSCPKCALNSSIIGESGESFLPAPVVTPPPPPPPPNPTLPHAHALYVEAEATISGPRRASYGEVRASFTKVGNMWTEILGVKVSAAQVALMMIAYKVCREANAHKGDNVVDIAGYAGLLAELEEGK